MDRELWFGRDAEDCASTSEMPSQAQPEGAQLVSRPSFSLDGVTAAAENPSQMAGECLDDNAAHGVSPEKPEVARTENKEVPVWTNGHGKKSKNAYAGVGHRPEIGCLPRSLDGAAVKVANSDEVETGGDDDNLAVEKSPTAKEAITHVEIDVARLKRQMDAITSLVTDRNQVNDNFLDLEEGSGPGVRKKVSLPSYQVSTNTEAPNSKNVGNVSGLEKQDKSLEGSQSADTGKAASVAGENTDIATDKRAKKRNLNDSESGQLRKIFKRELEQNVTINNETKGLEVGVSINEIENEERREILRSIDLAEKQSIVNHERDLQANEHLEVMTLQDAAESDILDIVQKHHKDSYEISDSQPLNTATVHMPSDHAYMKVPSPERPLDADAMIDAVIDAVIETSANWNSDTPEPQIPVNFNVSQSRKASHETTLDTNAKKKKSANKGGRPRDLVAWEPGLQLNIITNRLDPTVLEYNSMPEEQRPRIVDEPLFRVPFEYGWKREIVCRGINFETNGKKTMDIYYFSPVGKKLRSNVKVEEFLNQTGNLTLSRANFTFTACMVCYPHPHPNEQIRMAHINLHGWPIRKPKAGNPEVLDATNPDVTPLKKKKRKKVKNLSLNPHAASNPGTSVAAFQSPASTLTTTIDTTNGTAKVKKSTSSAKPASKKSASAKLPTSASSVETLPRTKLFILPDGRREEIPLARLERPVSPPRLLLDDDSSYSSSSDSDIYCEEVILNRGGPLVDLTITDDESTQDVTEITTVTPKQPTTSTGLSDENATSAAKTILDKPRTISGEYDSGILRPCSNECPGLRGVVPSLFCGVCLCLFHPACVGRDDSDGGNFICQPCSKATLSKTPNHTSPKNNGPSLASPPPLVMRTVIQPVVNSPTAAKSTPMPQLTVRPSGPPQPAKVPSVGTVQPILVRKQGSLYVVHQSASNVSPSSVQRQSTPTLPTLQERPLPIILQTRVTTQRALPSAPTLQPRPGVMVVTKAPPPLQRAPVRLPTTDTSSSSLATMPYLPMPQLTSSPVAIRAVCSQRSDGTLNVQSLLLEPHSATLGAVMARPRQYSGRGNNLCAQVSATVSSTSTVPTSTVTTADSTAESSTSPSASLQSFGCSASQMLAFMAKTASDEAPSASLRVAKESLRNDSQVARATDIPVKDSPTVCQQTPSAAPPAKTTSVAKQVLPSATESLASPLGTSENLSRSLSADCLRAVMSHLNCAQLIRSSWVCRSWRDTVAESGRWKRMSLRNLRILDWEKFADKVQTNNTQVLDMRGMVMHADRNRTWYEFASVLPRLQPLRRLFMCEVPQPVVHTVADALKQLECFVAESIVECTKDHLNTIQHCRIFIAHFSVLVNLKVLKIRGNYGLYLPSYSISEGLRSLSSLTKLTCLSLTSLKIVNPDDFVFLTDLTALTMLELGDCTKWNLETYKAVGRVTKLKHLRLEFGGESSLEGLKLALQNLKSLTILELIMFPIHQNLETVFPQLKDLRTFTIWPDMKYEAANTNLNLLNSLHLLPSLKDFIYGLVTADLQLINQGDPTVSGSTTSSNRLDHNLLCIPFPPGKLSVNSLMSRLQVRLKGRSKVQITIASNSGYSVINALLRRKQT